MHLFLFLNKENTLADTESLSKRLIMNLENG